MRRSWPALLPLLVLLLLLQAAPRGTAAGRPVCAVLRRGHFVYCRLERWTRRLHRTVVHRGRVRSLRIDIARGSSNLTKDHLRGFTSLRVLVVRGQCHRRPQTEFDANWRTECSDLRGIVRIHRGAFKHTPNLERLHFNAQPLVVLENLSPLTNLKVLHLKNAFALRLIVPQGLRGPHKSLEELTVLQNNISYVDSALLKQFKLLRSLSWSTVNSKVVYRTEAISELPNLTSLFLSCWTNCLIEGVLFELHALSDLPALRTVSFRNMQVVTVQDTPVCRRLGSIERLQYETMSPVLLHNCPELWRCERCGLHPKTHPQTILLHKIWLYTPERARDRRLARVLPPRALMPRLNVSIFHNTETYFRDLLDELGRFPLLQELHLHVPGTGQRPPLDYGTSKLVSNPLAFLPNPHKLRELRMIVQRCDCLMKEMISWAEQRLPQYARLQITCGNMRCACPRNHLAGVQLWIPPKNITNALAPYCSNRRSSFLRPKMPEVLCSIQSSCEEPVSIVRGPTSGQGRAIAGPAANLLFLVLLLGGPR